MDENPSSATHLTSTPLEPKVIDVARLIAEVLALDPGAVGRATMPLVSLPNLKVVVIGIRKGSLWNEHSTPGRITVQTLKGHIRMRALGNAYDLPAGHLLAFDSNVVHDVEALDDSAFLLTVARPE